MGLRINTNLPALGTQRQVDQSTNRLVQGLGRLATGLRINRAADDAAGLAIAERLRTETRQASQEINNLQQGVSVVQTAEGGLAQQQEGVQRLRGLALQAANGTLSDEQRAAINAEAQQIIQGIDTIAEDTEFNGMNLLNGDATEVPLGTESGEQVTINESTAASLGIAGLDLSTAEGAADAVDTIDTALTRVGQNRASVGAQESRFTRAIEQREVAVVNQQEAESRIRDLDVARQAIEQTRNEILQQGGMAALVQGNLANEAAARLLGG